MEHPRCIFRFADVEVDESTYSVTRAGDVLPVEPKVFKVLQFLLHHPGRVVTKDELLDAVWSDTSVSESSLTRSVATLRRLLGDDIHEPRYIATVPTVGYRFLCDVQVSENGFVPSSASAAEVPTSRTSDTEPNGSSAATKAGTSRSLFWVLLVLGTSVVVALLIGTVWYLRQPLPPPRITDYARLTLDGRLKIPVGTDASRLYLNFVDSPDGAAVVSLSGGEATRIPFEIPNLDLCAGCFPSIANSGVSPDGSRLLVMGRGDLSGDELWNVDSSGEPARFLTKGVFCATWSPDGKQVLYSTMHGELFVMPSEGGTPRLVLPSAVGPGENLPSLSLSWSPDGTRIRFVRDWKYWEVSPGGTNLHRVLPGWDDSTRVLEGHWTPDGDFFIFLAGKSSLDSNKPFTGQLWALDERRGRIGRRIAEPIRLTGGPNLWGFPIVSRDGNKIFSQQTTLRGELVRYDFKSKQFLPFLKGISADFVAFSRDAKYVAYVSFPDGILWRANRDGSGLVQLTRPPFYPKWISWSPDGTQIAFLDEHQTGDSAIYTISSLGSTPVRLVPDDPLPEVDPTWSPDGKQIAYSNDTRFSSFARSFSFETHILDLASHTLTTLPGFPGGFFSPRWSPDGRLLVGFAFSPPVPSRPVSCCYAAVVFFDLQTKQYRSLLGPLPENTALNWNWWSHDGRYIYFMSEVFTGKASLAILRVPIAGGKPETVVDLSGFQFTGSNSEWYGLDPQDAPILLRDRGTQEIYALNVHWP